MKNRTMTTNIGTINLAEISLSEDTLEIFIPIVEVSDNLKATIEEKIQQAKDEWQAECLDSRGKKWSDKGINLYQQELHITVKGKQFLYELCFSFEDLEDAVIWSGCNIEVDLSEHREELKKYIAHAVIERFF